MYLVNMAGVKSKYKRNIDTLEIYARKIKWQYAKGYTLQVWLCKGFDCYEGYISDLDKQVYFLSYTPTKRQKKLITAFCRNVAKKEGIKL